MRSRPRIPPVAGPVILAGALAIVLPASLGATTPTAPNLGLGYEYDLSGGREEFLLPDPLIDPSIASDHPLYVRIRAPWALLEPAPDRYDWSEVDRIVDPYREADFVVILCLHGSNPAIDPSNRAPTLGNAPLLKAWLEFTRAAALHFKGRVKYYQIWDEPNREPHWSVESIADFAYVLKNTSVTIRSADPGALIAQGGLAVGADSLDADLAWQKALYGQEVATYVDVLEVHPVPGAPLDRIVARTYDLLLDHDPSAQLWAGKVVALGSTDRARAAHLIEQFIVGQGEGAALVLFDLEADIEGRPEFPGVLLDLHKLFIPTYTRVPGGRLAFEPHEGRAGGRLEGVTSYVFFDADVFQGLVGFFARTPPEGGKARLVIDTAAVRGVVVYDIIGGAAGPVRTIDPDFKSNTTRVPVLVYDRPQVLQYARVPIKGFEAEKEEVEIQETGLITAEEVIAGHQAFMADQSFRLRNYRAEGLLTYHGKVAGSNTIDIGIDNAFYWDRETGAEWEQRALYYNGVLWRSEKLPPLPIPEVDKVFTLPLDINLNKDYTYEYVGRDRVGEFDCHVLDFKPIDRSKVLYEGRAWIETRTFALVKSATVQTRLSPPIISNEEKDYYAPMAGPDGTTFWILSRLEGQQILTVAGQNVVLLREIDFKNVRINDPGFDQVRQQAYRSDRQILRETDKGLKYLKRTETGDRVLADAPRKVWLGLAGLYRQPGLDLPVTPLLGAGYFNFRLRGKETQLTALLGGAVNLVTLSDPKTFGTRLDTNLQIVALAISVTDRPFVGGDEREESNVDVRAQSLSTSLGAPLGNFMRIKATYDLDYEDYGRDEDTDDTFVVPSSTLTQAPGIAWEFNRDAWTVSASARRAYRRDWKPWGDTTAPCTPGSCLSDFDVRQDTFDRFEFGVAKQVFLPLFQKLRFEATWQTGSRLDRFSQFQASFFGSRVRGFSGSGVRYDRGGIARAQYAFNVGNVVRFDASIDHAYVRDSLTSGEFERFTGFGVAGNLMGPWDSVIQFDVGVAVQSDVPGLRGGTEFLVGLLKYF